MLSTVWEQNSLQDATSYAGRDVKGNSADRMQRAMRGEDATSSRGGRGRVRGRGGVAGIITRCFSLSYYRGGNESRSHTIGNPTFIRSA